MITIKLTQGLSDNDQYKAFKFPGGELHIVFKENYTHIVGEFLIQTRINTSDDLILLILAIETLKKDWPNKKIGVFIPYMPYQQADRDFSIGECFSLKTITTILNSLPVESYTIYDPHSDVTPALLKNCHVIKNSNYIKKVVSVLSNELILLSPDAGAYKKIYKLAKDIEFNGEIASANKSRSLSTGNIDSIELSRQDFEGKPILIVDDICVGGRTFVELAKKLQERNAGKLYLAISHGIFSNGLTELAKYFTKVFTTNSRSETFPLYEGVINLGDLIDDNQFLNVYKIF